MKHTATILACIASILLTEPASADFTVTSPSGKLVVNTCAYDAEAVCKVMLNGVQFIDDTDHGRQLQSSATFDQWLQNYNPTEAGASIPFNGSNPSPTSSIASYYVPGKQPSNSTQILTNTLTGTTQMAYWFPVNGATVSNWSITKTIMACDAVGASNSPLGYLVITSTFTASAVEPAHSYYQFETLTGYMPAAFYIFYRYQNAAWSMFTAPNMEQPYPLIVTDGNNAMGIYNPNLPQQGYPGAGYGAWYFSNAIPNPVAKWNAVFRYAPTGTATSTPPICPNGVCNNVTFTNFVAIGNVLSDVQTLIGNWTSALPSATQCPPSNQTQTLKAGAKNQ